MQSDEMFEYELAHIDREFNRPLTDDEREEYAPAGTLLRKSLDDGLVPWPSHGQAVMDLARLGGMGEWRWIRA